MQFPPNFFTSFTIPTGAGPGTSRIVLSSDGSLISYDNTDVPNTFAALFNGQFFFGPQTVAKAADFTQAGTIGYTIIFPGTVNAAAALFDSPIQGAINLQSELLMFPGNNDPIACPFFLLHEKTSTTVASASITGAWTQAPADPNAFGPYGWFSAPVSAANWAVDLGNPLRYRHRAEDDVEWVGELQYSGANVAAAGGTIITDPTIDATYHPKFNHYITVSHLTSGRVQKNTSATAIIRTDGRLSIIWGDGVAGTAHDVNGLATGDIFSIQCRIPLGTYIQD